MTVTLAITQAAASDFSDDELFAMVDPTQPSGARTRQGSVGALKTALDGRYLSATGYKSLGTTAERLALTLPSTISHLFVDTDLGKPTFWNGTTWTDYTGAPLGATVNPTPVFTKALSAGDGNGLKLGGQRTAGNGNTTGISGPHIVRNCVSWGNKLNGFDNNGGKGALTLYNCTGFDNCKDTAQTWTRNFYLGSDPSSGVNTIKNCLSYHATSGKDYQAGSTTVSTTNSWSTFSPALTVNAATFASLDDTASTAPTSARQANGSLPISSFLRLTSATAVIDKGTNVGIAFNGTAPDLGAFEYGTNTVPAYALPALGTGTTYYVAPDGVNSAGRGDIGQPFLTLAYAYALAVAGDTIVLRGGVYDLGTGNGIQITGRSGASGNPITIMAYAGEEPILDGSNLTGSYAGTGNPGGYGLGFYNVNWLVVRGLTVRNCRYGGISIIGNGAAPTSSTNAVNNCVFANLKIYKNGWGSPDEGKGLSMFHGCTNNTIQNCDSFANKDTAEANADGFQLSPLGTGNVIRGCRAWLNSDDGFDFFNITNNTTQAALTIEHCWAWNNGYKVTSGSPV